MSRLIFFSLLLGACTTGPSIDPELPLVTRFEMVAFGPGDSGDRSYLWKWSWPIRVQVNGPQQYHQKVAEHLELLGELTGLPIEMGSTRPNMIIEFSLREERWWCRYELVPTTSRYSAQISIRTDQSQHDIRRCIVQEMTQALGLRADTDGRRDTAFSSAIGTDYLTTADRQLLAILYDRRLLDRMPHDEVMAAVQQIVADIEQEAERQ